MKIYRVQYQDYDSHEAAQSVAWFAVVVLFGVAVVIYLDIRKESRNEKQSAKRAEPSSVQKCSSTEHLL